MWFQQNQPRDRGSRPRGRFDIQIELGPGPQAAFTDLAALVVFSFNLMVFKLNLVRFQPKSHSVLRTSWDLGWNHTRLSDLNGLITYNIHLAPGLCTICTTKHWARAKIFQWGLVINIGKVMARGQIHQIKNEDTGASSIDSQDYTDHTV